MSLPCLGGNYLFLNPKINYIPINWQFTHWGNAYTCYNQIPYQKMDGTCSICQTTVCSFLCFPWRSGCLLAVSVAQGSPTVSGVFQVLQSVFTWLDDRGKKHLNKQCMKTITRHPFSLTFAAAEKTTGWQLPWLEIHFLLYYLWWEVLWWCLPHVLLYLFHIISLNGMPSILHINIRFVIMIISVH